MSEPQAAHEDNEQKKIELVINSIQVEEHLDKHQLHKVFLTAGLEEVNDTVRDDFKVSFNIFTSVSANRPDLLTARRGE